MATDTLVLERVRRSLGGGGRGSLRVLFVGETWDSALRLFSGLFVQSGYFAAGTFLLFTGVGVAVQVLKLAQRTAAWRAGTIERSAVCEGLHPVREMWSFSAYFCFALSGLTRSYLDLFIFFSRAPVIILSTVILWYLRYHGAPRGRRNFSLALSADSGLLILALLIAAGMSIHGSVVPLVVDVAMVAVSALLFYGKQLQALVMYRTQQSRAVSMIRELGIIMKDLAGLWYALSIGSELFWIAVTHSLSAISSGMIVLMKLYLEHKPAKVI